MPSWEELLVFLMVPEGSGHGLLGSMCFGRLSLWWKWLAKAAVHILADGKQGPLLVVYSESLKPLSWIPTRGTVAMFHD